MFATQHEDDLFLAFLERRRAEQTNGRPVVRSPIYVSEYENYVFQVLRGDRILKVDTGDAALLAGYRWFLNEKSPGHFYAATDRQTDNVRRRIHLHNLLMPSMPGLLVDHINGDSLDNRRSNLRYATPSQNAFNRRVIRSKSGFKGVVQVGKKFAAMIRHGGKLFHLGRFETAEMAARAYDRAARSMCWNFAATNEDLGAFQRDSKPRFV